MAGKKTAGSIDRYVILSIEASEAYEGHQRKLMECRAGRCDGRLELRTPRANLAGLCGCRCLLLVLGRVWSAAWMSPRSLTKSQVFDSVVWKDN